ncbi:MAG: carbon starvation protein A [Muribaculaceae bacterium]|nr:carbon starvation protein A [Muribaculaceae bacterium]
MTSFLIALAVLILGYIVYGYIVDRIIVTDPKREMPAYSMRDGVDYVPMSTWKVFLIQFLNIAGLGPIFGAIMGIMFGPAAFLWIVFGTIFGGAVHDFLSGVISIRMNGASLPEIVGSELGKSVKLVMRVFSILLLILVGANFVVNPAAIIANLFDASGGSILTEPLFWVSLIFVYYILATLLPIDKLIGRLYPLFGFALLFMAFGIMGYMLFGDVTIPDGFADGLYNRHPNAESMPIFPMMFVSIACGAISGFHATQSPMMARCLKNEKYARPIFFGAMVAEGIVALIWAAATITFVGGYDGIEGFKPAVLVNEISKSWLGTFGGILAILGVVAAPITTGDTALRSARLIAADFLHVKQDKIIRRLMISLPIFALTFVFLLVDYSVLWRYFAWSNQTLSVFTLMAVTAYLARHRRNFVVSLIPALFMTVVCVTYILFSPEGLRLDYTLSVSVAVGVAALLLLLFVRDVLMIKHHHGPAENHK